MTLHDVKRYYSHWKRYPPLRWLVSACAIALGIKLPEPTPEENKNYVSAEEFARIAAQFGSVPVEERGRGR